MTASIAETIMEDRDLGKLVRVLVGRFDPERVYLYGDAAQGSTTDCETYHLVMVVSSAHDPQHQEKEIAEITTGLGASTPVRVLTRHEFEGQLEIPESLPNLVAQNGWVLYGI